MAVLGYLEKLIMRKVIYFKDDYLFVKDRKFMLVSASSLSKQYLESYKAVGIRFWTILYYAGKEASKEYAIEVSQLAVGNLINLLEFSCNSLNAFGEGNFRVQKYDEKKPLMVINADKSTLAEESKKANGPLDAPIDYFLLGVFVGSMEYKLKKEFFGYEINCKAERDVNSCTFITGDEAPLLEYVRQFAPKKEKAFQDFLKDIKAYKVQNNVSGN
jgi:hypothetical protein